MRDVLARAVDDAVLLQRGGCDALLVENMADLPYLRGYALPETVAAMALAVERVAALGLPVGVQVLAAANREALAVAAVAGATFIRVEAFAYGHLADEGWMDSCAGELLRARRHLGVPVAVWADVQKKHAAHAATADRTLEELSQGAAFCGADALIATGSATGQPTSLAHVHALGSAGLPVVVGSGVDDGNLASLAQHAQAVIVGSWLKEEGDWRRPVDLERVRALRRVLNDGR